MRTEMIDGEECIVLEARMHGDLLSIEGMMAGEPRDGADEPIPSLPFKRHSYIHGGFNWFDSQHGTWGRDWSAFRPSHLDVYRHRLAGPMKPA